MTLEYKPIENITIFIPKKLFYTKSTSLFYGKCIQREAVVKFYVISDKEHQQLEFIGVNDPSSHCESLENLKNVFRLSSSNDVEEVATVRKYSYTQFKQTNYTEYYFSA